MKKIVLVTFISFFIIFPAFMQLSGEVSITKKLLVIKTEYFDFIFPKESEPTAKHLAQQADDLYRKAAAFLQIESTSRLPVIITTKKDNLNAYFTPFPMYRIVMYDTVPSEFLAVFSDSLVSIFYHEIIHALSLDIKSSVWRFYSSLFGEIPSLGLLLNMPRSFIEGTAVLAESFDGEGRLYSAYALHVLRQAKIEGKFPDWRDITGGYQLYTDGSLPYIFGGAFFNYLYQIYGSKKFSEFWNENSKSNFRLNKGVFEKVYARSLDDSWQDFENSVYIPPLTLPSQSLFLPKSVIARTTTDHLYQNLTASPNGIAWQDGFSGAVYFLPNNVENQKARRLYTTDLTSRLLFSRDGRYLVSSGFREGVREQNTVRVHDMESDKNVRTQRNLRDGAIITIPKDANIGLESPLWGVSTVLAGIQTDAALASLVLYDFDSPQDSKPLLVIPFERNTILFKPLDAGNGLIVALMQNFGDWQFFVYDSITGTQGSYTISDPSFGVTTIRDIYASDTMLYMSYAATAFSQPVLARINLSDFNTKTLTVYVQTEQVSGGVFNPVVISDPIQDSQMEIAQNETVQIAHISRYYEDRALSVLPITSDTSFKAVTFVPFIPLDSPVKTPIDYPIEPYRSYEYTNNGVLLPFIGSINLNPFTDFLPKSFSIGLSAMTIDPIGRLILLGGGGYDIEANNFTTALSAIFNENYFTAITEVFTSSSAVELNTFATKLYIDLTLPIAYDFNTIRFENTLSYFYLAKKNDYLLNGNTVYNKIKISFNHLRKTGQFFYDRAGFNFGTQVTIEKNFTNNTRLDNEYGIFIGVQLSQLLPFKNPERFALNFPSRIIAYRYFNAEKLWELQTTAVLFSYDIQKGISFFPLFFQRLTLKAGLDSMWYKSGDPELTLHGSLFTTLSVNAGLLAQVPVDLGVSFTWEPHIKGIEGLNVNFKFGLSL